MNMDKGDLLEKLKSLEEELNNFDKTSSTVTLEEVESWKTRINSIK